MTTGSEIDAAEIDAVVFDLDGVITRTADVHERSWLRLFNGYLKVRSERTGEPFKGFSGEDYLAYVDGKPRYDGVQSFLESRAIHLPWGSPDDGPDLETVCGLGNLKNQYFLEVLREDGVDSYQSSVDLVRELQRQGVGTALISSSRNLHDVLDAAGLTDLFSVVIDGVVADQLGIPGKPHPAVFLEAARRLRASPSRSAIVEDALSGVEAGDRGEFAMVIGVDRADHAVDLSSHGATLVVHDLGEITVKPAPRPTRDQLPSAVDHLQDLLHELGASEPVVFLDYDGTLTPIVEHPDLALLDDETRAVITDLASVVTVAVLSGRDVLDVQDKMQVPGIYYAGSHGFDIIDPSGRAVEHDRMSRFRRYLGPLDQVAERLEAELRGVPGSQVERKRFAVAVHFRRVAETDLTRVERSVRETARDFPQLRISTGKKVLELRPDFDWDKGRALTWLLSQMGPDPMLMTPIYIGDDDTDEDAFSVIRRLGIGVVVGREREPTCARWALENTSEVREFLAACSARWKRAR